MKTLGSYAQQMQMSFIYNICKLWLLFVLFAHTRQVRWIYTNSLWAQELHTYLTREVIHFQIQFAGNLTKFISKKRKVFSYIYVYRWIFVQKKISKPCHKPNLGAPLHELTNSKMHTFNEKLSADVLVCQRPNVCKVKAE